MAIWAIMGIGMLINTVEGMVGGGPSSQMQSYVKQMQARTAEMGHSEQADLGLFEHKDPVFKTAMNFDFTAPDFPQQNYENLQQMQMGHMQEHAQAEQNLQQNLSQMKEDFFKGNHYETQFGSEGKPQVVTDQHGQPNVQQGPETPEQCMARQSFEAAQKSQLASKHADQRDTFVKKQNQQITQFLNQNATALGDPVRQGELQQMIVDSKKKALKLQQDQEDERWRVDLPPSVEMHQKVDDGLEQLRQMEQRHAKAEEDSPDVQALMSYDQKVAAVLEEKKQEVRAQHSNDNFLMNPRQIMAATTAPKTDGDFSRVLPGYLTNALFRMGIYSA